MNPRVLIVDDEEAVRNMMVAIVVKDGGAVFQAQDGVEALEVLKEERIDLVLLDMSMPNMDGRQTLSRIREENPTLPVVLVSGYVDQDITRGIELGSHTMFVHKPFRRRTLHEALARLLPKV